MAVAARWTGASRRCSRPLLGRSVEQVQGVVQHVRLVGFGVTSKDNKGIADEETGMADPGAGAFGSGGDGETAGAARDSLEHPQISLDGGAIDQAAHDVDGAIF